MDVLGQERREGLGRRSSSSPLSLLLFMLVSAILLLSSLYAAEASVFRKARESAIEAASPLLSVFSGPVGFVQDMVGGVRDYFFVLEQNKALREEISDLRQWEQEARDLREVIAAYETLGFYHPAPSPEPVNAAVVGESNDAFTHTMIVNAGRDEAVLPGQAVVDDRGLVGRIVHSSKNAARVLLLTDVQSSVPVYLENSEIEGILVGQTGARPAISFTRYDDLENIVVGDRVVTSGAGGALPRGLPVGVIDRVTERGALVALQSNYARTRLVRIINYKFPGMREGPRPGLVDGLVDELGGDDADPGVEENEETGDAMVESADGDEAAVLAAQGGDAAGGEGADASP
ncbi:MAG: rod shape-determining protein MreC [Pseudomonadota bacterium]